MIPAHHPPGNLLCSFVLRHRQIHNSRRLSSLLSGGGYRSAGSTKEGKNNGSLSLSLSLSLLFHRVSAPRMRVGENPHLYRLPTARGSIRQRSTLTALQELVRSGALQPDRAQERVAKRLDRLQAALADYDNSVLFPQTQKQSSGESPSSEKREDDQTDDKEQERLLDLDATNDKTKKKTTAAKTNQCNDIDNDNDNDNSDSSGISSLPPPIPHLKIPRGLYIYGSVGTGKTMLMDSFYDNARVPGNDRKQRFHFHDFLSKIHESVHRLKRDDLREKGRNFSIDTSPSNNPIHRVGLRIASELSLLCLDEFQVTDIADAVILSGLFSVLFRHGTIVVATSNRPPGDLYEGGLNRSYFLPFIDLLEHHCIAHHIPSDRDYRRMLSNCSSFFICLAGDGDGETATAADGIGIGTGIGIGVGVGVGANQVDALAEELAAGNFFATDDNGASSNDGNNNNNDDDDDALFRSIELGVGFNRSISVGRVCNYNGETNNKNDDDGEGGRRNGKPPPSVARFSFGELCDADLGASDYRAVANAFDVVILENLPTMDLEGHNRARRFITLIDELYEGKCALVCSTLEANTPRELFRTSAAGANEPSVAPSTTGSSSSSSNSDRDNNATNVVVEDDSASPHHYNESDDDDDDTNLDSELLGIDVAQEGGTPVGALASVRELSFAFERSSSRIFEMCSRSWWDRVLGDSSTHTHSPTTL